MTAEYGLLMFLYGMIAIFIGAVIAYKIINIEHKFCCFDEFRLKS